MGILVLTLLASSILLLVEYIGVETPLWVPYAANPIAWLSNHFNLTSLLSGFFPGMESAIAWLPAQLGIPVLGTLLIWYVWAFLPSHSGWMSLIFGLLGCIAFQFTVERAYISLATEYRQDGKREHETRATLKALHIIEASGAYKSDLKYVFDAMARLRELQPSGHTLAKIVPEPVHLRLANLEITLKSHHFAPPFPLFVRTTNWFRSFKQMLSGMESDYDLEDIGRLKALDLRAFIGVELLSSLAIERRMLPKLYPYPDVSTFTQHPIHLIVVIHDSLQDFQRSISIRPHSIASPGSLTSSLMAYYDRDSTTLHVVVPDDLYVERTRKFYELLMNEGTREALKNKEMSAEMRRNEDTYARYLRDNLYTPLAHELWHFTAHHLPSFKGLPPALEEGMALLAQMPQEVVGESAIENMELFNSLLAGKFIDRHRDKLLVARSPKCGITQRYYADAIREAAKHHSVIPAKVLLSFQSSEMHTRPDVNLFYAESWALAARVWFSPELFAKVKTAVSVSDSTFPLHESDSFWDGLTDEIVKMGREMCP